MTASTGIDHIQTTHAGSLPRTPEILAANEARAQGRDSGELEQLLATAVVDVVARQKAAGIEIANDGEYGHTMTGPVDYGAWWNYVFARLGGLEQTDFDRWADRTQHRSSPGHIVLTSFYDRRDRARFREAYEEPTSGILAHRKAATQPKVAGPLTYIGHDDVRRDVANLTNALRENGMSTGFIASLSPGSCARITNEYYRTEEELLFACADAMREEYMAILDAGLNVQLDDPSLAESWDQINPEPALEDYRAYIAKRIEATNHALRGLPKERIRMHVCWGSWHGPHTTDIPFADIVDEVLKANVGTFVSRRATCATSTSGGSGRRRSCPRAPGSRPASSATRRTSSSTPTSSPTASSGSRASSAARTSSPPPTAVSAGGCTRRSRGPSSRPSARVLGAPPRGSGGSRLRPRPEVGSARRVRPRRGCPAPAACGGTAGPARRARRRPRAAARRRPRTRCAGPARAGRAGACRAGRRRAAARGR